MNCESCGMPMLKTEDHGGKDPNNKWCIHCCHNNGSHKSREEVREGMIQFTLSEVGKEFSKTMRQKVCDTRAEAEERVDEIMSSMPAWKD